MERPVPIDRCLELANPDYSNFAASLFILIGILVSYLPQHIRIIQRWSSAGISPYFVLLGMTSGTCGLANILAQPVSRVDIACCKVNDDFACFAGLLGVLQIGTQWTCFALIMLLWLIYFPRASALSPPNDPAANPPFSVALYVTSLCIFHMFAQAVANLVVASRYTLHLQAYANAIGIMATILAAIQYFPQIWTTWRLKAVGSLSIPMMCIQTPGSYVWAISLGTRMGWAGWSTWGIYVITGALQGVLLVMGITFELRNRRLRKAGLLTENENSHDGGEDAEEEGTDENTPLLHGSREPTQAERIE